MIPIAGYLSKRFEKHRALGFAFLFLILGDAIQWFVYVPGEPHWQWFLPIFDAVGLTCFWTILVSMYADLTDDDELKTGERREAMIGAVISLMNKFMDIFQTFLAAAVITIAGFEISKGANQDPGVFFNMRLMCSLMPAAFLCLGLLLLWRYPLNRARIAEIKVELARRRAAAEQK